ncbi:thiolase family protein [Chloroflexota bacterium]
MSKRRACIIAAGVADFGVRQAHVVDLFQEAAKRCLDDIPGLNHKDIDGILVATSLAGRSSSQTNTAPVVAERLGLKPTSICTRVDTLCAGGNSGILLAKALVESGMSDMVMVTGAEKMYTPERWETFYTELTVAEHDWDCAHGMGLPPAFFALQAKEHMKYYGTTKEQLAAVSVTNYNFGSVNPTAHFQKKITMEEVLEARPIVPPLTLYDCCPITDGAAATIIAVEEKAKELSDRPLVYIRGGAQVLLHSVSANFPGGRFGDWPNLRLAAEKAYKNAKVGPDDIDVANIHDCFTISEIIEVEELGFCKKGEGGPYVASGQINIGGKVPVNTDGGLISCGHPFGATGIRQATELLKQLQGRATFQVEGAEIGLAHNLSGYCTEQTIVIYGKEPVN